MNFVFIKIIFNLENAQNVLGNSDQMHLIVISTVFILKKKKHVSG